MGQALVVKDKDDNLMLQGRQGNLRPLPRDLYDRLAPISHQYDSKKDFIGYVDPVAGVVIVDASCLEEEFNKTTRNQKPSSGCESDSEEPLLLRKLTREDSVEDLTQPEETSMARDEQNRSRTQNYSADKTMHQLAYEFITGSVVPDDEFRPISGFGIKHGKLIFNSSTFNAFHDDYHTEERDMGDVERTKLQAMVDRLNEDEKSSRGPSSLTPSQCW